MKQRIASLIASSTEIVCALGFEDNLVAISHECDFPPSIHSRPVCTEPRIDVSGSSSDVDRRVKETVAGGLSVYRVYTDLLRELQPDLILTQMQCEVCAVSLRDVDAALADWLGAEPQVVALSPNSLEDIFQSFSTVAQTLGAPDRGEQLIRDLRGRIAAVSALVETVERRPSIACIEWLDPLMAAGNWVPELVELAGGRNLFGKAKAHSPWMSWQDLISKDPDCIIALPCGYGINKTRAELTALTKKTEWKSLRAVQTKSVFVVDGNQFFNRPGPRIVDSLEILGEILHPDAFPPRHSGSGWERFAG